MRVISSLWLVLFAVYPSASWKLLSFKSKIFTSTILATSLATVSTVHLAIANEVSEQPKIQVNGLKKGRLLSCKTNSNCISTSAINSIEKYGRPWTFTKSVDDEFNDILNAIKADQYLKIVDERQDLGYIRAEGRSAVPPTGTDDVEFLLNPLDNIITYRSSELFAQT